MASQQILFAETIAGMKKAFKRKAYESDSDSEIENYGNRGYKLKKRARFVQRGQLMPSAGPSSYRETVDYAGVTRSILFRNPAAIDNDGYEIDSDDEEKMEDAMAVAAELNPYANIRIENILAPLTGSTDLPTHITLSKPFVSRTLTDLADQSCLMMRKENQSLWQVRHLWTSFCGDGTWVPCETMVTPNDINVFSDEHVAQHLLSLSKLQPAGEAAASDRPPAPSDGNTPNGGPDTTGADGDVPMEDAESLQRPKMTAASLDTNGIGVHLPNGDAKASHGADNDDVQPASGGGKPTNGMGGADQGVASGHSVTSGPPDADFIHPMFLPPTSAQTDRDLGLQEQEAEHIRRLLAMYVQKQEEVCRGTQRLHQGLLKAERLRKDVLRWSKAEAHAGPNQDMSDGEDWYDKEEWGLAEDLKKGQDEEEEDAVTTGKKTRARR